MRWPEYKEGDYYQELIFAFLPHRCEDKRIYWWEFIWKITVHREGKTITTYRSAR